MSLSDARERGQFGVLVAFGLHHDEERVELRYGWSSGLMDEAARYGQLGVIEWLHAHRFEGCTHLAMRFAAERGHLKIVQWLHANRGVRCTRKVMDEAAKNGHLHVVQWLHDNRSEGCTQLAMDSAARNGHLCLVQWLHENRLEGCTTKAMDGAAKRGHLPVVQWLHESRTEGCTQKAMDGAAGNGELALVQWLHSSRSEGCTKKAMDKAAANGHLAVVQWLHKNRHEGCTEEAMDRAAGSGHLAIVQWLHENRSEGCTRWAMDGAAINSHASVVAWLDENRKEGCSPSVVDRVLELGQLDIMKTLYDRDELKSWPYPTQVNHLVGQLKSGDPKRLAILSYIASKRKERFCTNAVDNPRCVRDEEAAVVYRTAQSNAERQPYRLMAEKIMSMRRKLPDVIGEHVSGFILDNPTKRWRRSDARKRGWVFWLMQFSIYQNEDMVRLGKYGHWDGARKIHDYLSAKKQLHCTKYFLYLSVAKADLEFAQWHLRMCGAHSVREWLYLATWIGRVDIVEWMCEAWSELRLLKRKVGERDVCAKEHFRSSSGRTVGGSLSWVV